MASDFPMGGIYRELVTTKIIRRRYQIRVLMDTTAKAFTEAFSKVPPDAKLVDCESTEGEGEIWTFEVEEEQPKPETESEGK